MNKRVLDVGNCAMDHSAIRRLVEGTFDAHVVQAHDGQEALEQLRQERYVLMLVNRQLDQDASDGLGVIRQIKSDPELSQTPCMLITNFAEHQRLAVAEGAVEGFGKADLEDPRVPERLRPFLAE